MFTVVNSEKKINAAREKSMDGFVAALVALMRDKPYGDISVSELCDAAGLARKTFYRNFKSKDEVVEYRLDKFFVEIERRFDISVSTVKSIFTFCFESLFTERGLVAIVIEPELDDVIIRKVKHYVEYSFADVLHNVVSFEPKFMDYYTDFIAVGIVSVLKIWAKTGCKTPPAVMANLTEHLLSGVIV